jgi:hypothetical protein
LCAEQIGNDAFDRLVDEVPGWESFRNRSFGEGAAHALPSVGYSVSVTLATL